MKNVIRLEAIPDELRRLPQWVCWRFVQRSGKPTKLPINCASGHRQAVPTGPPGRRSIMPWPSGKITTQMGSVSFLPRAVVSSASTSTNAATQRQVLSNRGLVQDH